jgi:hypothetical protein
MYLVTEMNWSDIAMGDGNPQTQVALRNTLEEAQQAVVDLVKAEYCPEDDDGEEVEVESFEQAVEFLRSAPGTPEVDITEISLSDEFQYLSRDALDGSESTRIFNGHRTSGEPESNGLVCASCKRRMKNDKVEKIAQLEKEVARLREILTRKLGE